MHAESQVRIPLVTGGKTVHDVTQDVCSRVEEKPSRLWLMAMAISLALLSVGAYAVYLLLWNGIGMWGLNKTVPQEKDVTSGFIIGSIFFAYPSGRDTCQYSIDLDHFSGCLSSIAPPVQRIPWQRIMHTAN